MPELKAQISKRKIRKSMSHGYSMVKSYFMILQPKFGLSDKQAVKARLYYSRFILR